ncbi:class I SAM-dependent methyltransferase [Paenibacillus xerothermodurans]|uniref:SAM-dependent methyltransferase n=1 Tax=Paenibacillus xerothermodurans TaxID=1977292 RepID=A0A2W1NQT7_PAEXE|nr:class I SAM-dependent methyltransferase [Paenibacillus xerothermodurans]PZE21855.1 SAM-dependent methyltransferase [Paenibacillus xerothermodurans]
MLVTTSYDPGPEQVALAECLVRQLRELPEIAEPVRPVARRRQSLSRISERYDDTSILLVSKERIEYYQEQQPVLFFHPSLAAIRVKRLLNGEPDTLIELSRLKCGDRVLDCTAGLGSDAIVYSFALGSKGEVVALESQAIPYLLLQHGLSAYHSDIPGMNEAMRRIQVQQADHYDFLRKQPDKAFDVIYFDPMFRKPIQESNSIGAIRGLADPRAVSEATIREAVRVARRTIVLKEHRDSKEFARLGVTEVHRSTTKIAYGVIRL